MNVNEFRAWLEGFSFSFPEDRVPTAEQWAVILERILMIKSAGPKPK